MIQDYFNTITIKRRVRVSDGLGGFTVTYSTIGTVQGLLERSNSTERIIAAKRGVDDVYTFMTDTLQNTITPLVGDVVTANGITAILKSSGLIGQAKSNTMKNILQFTADSYVEV